MQSERETHEEDGLIDLGQASHLTQGEFSPNDVENLQVIDFRD